MSTVTCEPCAQDIRLDDGANAEQRRGSDELEQSGNAADGRGNLCSNFFFSSRRRHTRFDCDWSSDVCSSDLQCLIALADAEPLMKQLFDHRFTEGSLNGHSFGNLFIMAMADVTGNFEHALRESGKVLAVKGTIVPSTLQDVTLVASINGSNVEGESKIPKQNSAISHVFLKPDGVQVNPEAAQAILNAELITVGPGSLYTSILPNLLVQGMVEAIKASPALKLYICNLAAQPGETDGYGIDDYLHVIREHVGSNLFDFVLVNSNHSQIG